MHTCALGFARSSSFSRSESPYVFHREGLLLNVSRSVRIINIPPSVPYSASFCPGTYIDGEKSDQCDIALRRPSRIGRCGILVQFTCIGDRPWTRCPRLVRCDEGSSYVFNRMNSSDNDGNRRDQEGYHTNAALITNHELVQESAGTTLRSPSTPPASTAQNTTGLEGLCTPRRGSPNAQRACCCIACLF